MEECGKKGVKGAVIISAGFKETGPEGKKREEELLKIAKKHNIRVIGPNCMGILNADPDIRLDANFALVHPPYGSVALIAQSGALGDMLMEKAYNENLGINKFFSIGNKMDVTSNDLLEAFAEDKDINLVLMYLEDFGDPRKFAEVARKITQKKPVIAMKAARTFAGQKAASSHTGTLIGSDEAVDAIFDQVGIIRANSIGEMFDYAKGFKCGGGYQGNRVAIVTNAGGPAIMATDAFITDGFEMAKFSDKTAKAIRRIIAEEGASGNPVDLIASGSPQQFQKVMELALKDPNVDMAVLLYMSPLYSNVDEIVARLTKLVEYTTKPVLACMLGLWTVPAELYKSKELKYPIFQFPESAVKAISGLRRYHLWKKRQHGKLKRFKVDKNKAKKVLGKVKKQKRTRLTYTECKEVLSAYGFRFPDGALVKNADDALEAGAELEFPVVMKISSLELSHKSDIGGVILDIRDVNELLLAFNKMKKNIKPRVWKRAEGITIEQMIKGGVETILGMKQDPKFGPLVVFGMGGIMVEIMGDFTVRIPPLTDQDAEEMIMAMKGYPLLTGYRGDTPKDIKNLIELVQRFSHLVVDFEGEIESMEINPLIALEKGACCVDAKIVLKE
jgi:acetyltransferase